MRRAALLTSTLGLLACLIAASSAAAAQVVLVRGSHASLANDPALPGADAIDLPPPPFASTQARVAVGGPTVARALGAAPISAGARARYRGIYRRALAAAARLGGLRRTELQAVIDGVRELARRRQLTVPRLPVVFLELQRNTEYWPANGAPTAPPQGIGLGGARVEFGRDPVVLQWYPGEGLRIQQLATAGRVNGLDSGCEASPGTCDRSALRTALDRLITLASTRSGFLAWEYLFTFGGGAPPWISGMAQGTAMQALTRGAAILGDPKYLRAAGRALGAFERSPTVGVRARTRMGAHYLLYSFAPRYFVLNGFLQALIGLYDYARASASARALALFAAGDREARAELPRYDTGSWSRYSIGGPLADLGYQRLARDFLRRLCRRTGARAYCAAADRFTRYLRQR